MTNETKKRNKKKMLIIALFIFAVVGIAGYGVYSYYWTEGEFEGDSSPISVISFDPEVNVSGSDTFLGDGGTVSFSCNDNRGTTHSTQVTCSAQLEVSNHGESTIGVKVQDLEASMRKDDGVTFEPSIVNTRYSWSSEPDENDGEILEPGESATLTVEVVVGTNDHIYTSSGVEVDSPLTGGYISPNVTFKLRATQVH